MASFFSLFLFFTILAFPLFPDFPLSFWIFSSFPILARFSPFLLLIFSSIFCCCFLPKFFCQKEHSAPLLASLCHCVFVKNCDHCTEKCKPVTFSNTSLEFDFYIKGIFSDSNSTFLWHKSGDINKKRLFPKFQLILIFH